jgi:hypothetical protein
MHGYKFIYVSSTKLVDAWAGKSLSYHLERRGGGLALENVHASTFNNSICRLLELPG